jgi:hypothetical protein
MLVGEKPNPGGRWEASALLKVHLKNDSQRTLFWSRDRDVWHVTFAGPGFTAPPAWSYPRPPPERHGPIHLAPGERAQMSLDISEAFDIWPLVEPGEYTVQVVYTPDQLLTFASGTGGAYRHPYNVPGFQKGTFVTPALTVEVRHPWLSDADIRNKAEGLGGGLRIVSGGREIWLRRVKDEDLRFLSRVPDLKALSIGEAYTTDAGLRYLASLKDLRRLDLMARQVTDEGLIHLRGLTELEHLSLQETQINGPGLQYVQPLKGLKLLDLHDSPVTDEGILYLTKLTALRALSLWGTRTTDDGLENLRLLPHLEQLNLWDTNVTDAGLRHLVGLGLRDLSLSGKAITDAGLVYVRQLDRLEGLDLAVTHITDRGIRHLQAMKALRWLNFEGSGPTPAGLAQLRRSLPNTKITGPGSIK